ncbi:hypothetical protein J3F84DRAFT_371829 [Trichoderma pleuroticola]
MTARQSSLRPHHIAAKHSSDRFCLFSSSLVSRLSALQAAARESGRRPRGREGPAGRSCCDAIVSRVGLDF